MYFHVCVLPVCYAFVSLFYVRVHFSCDLRVHICTRASVSTPFKLLQSNDIFAISIFSLWTMKFKTKNILFIFLELHLEAYIDNIVDKP